jgi:hypothetical protein
VYEPDRPWPIESKGFCISRGGMQKILHEMCERAVLSERRFSVACAPKDSAGRATSVFGFNGNQPYSSTALLIRFWTVEKDGSLCARNGFCSRILANSSAASKYKIF